MLSRGYLIAEILLVLGLSLGRSGVYAIVNLLADLTSGVPLAEQTATLNASAVRQARPRPDPATAAHRFRIGHRRARRLSAASLRGKPGTLGVDAQQPGKDTRRGAALAALVGLTGLAWYLIAYRAGINLSVSAQGLPTSGGVRRSLCSGLWRTRSSRRSWSWASCYIDCARSGGAGPAPSGPAH